MRLTKNVTLVVLSTDSFEDCWRPFFTLLETYWPGCGLPIVLTSETKSYRHPGLDVTSTQAMNSFGYWPSWSESLLLALELVETPLVLTMLDDFFLNGPADLDMLQRCVDLVLEYGYPTVALTEHGLWRPSSPSDHEELRLVDRSARYRLTTSPALWGVEALRSYVHPPENIWQFEILGSWRARRRDEKFFIANPEMLRNGAEGVLPYFQAENDTGIVKGGWQRGIPTLFEEHDIEVDFSKRGFFVPAGRLGSQYRTIQKLLHKPRTCLFGGSLSRPSQSP